MTDVMPDVRPVADGPQVPARDGGRRRRSPLTWVVVAIFAAVAASTIYPVVFIIVSSLRTDEDYNSSPSGLPRAFTWANLSRAWGDAGLGRYAINSLIVVSLAVVLLTFTACLAGFAFAHLRLPFSRTILESVILLMIVPPSVLLIPIFQMVQNLGMLNSYLGLILVYGSLNLPFSIFLMTTYMRGIPIQLFEAARVDGASSWRSFWSIALPLSRPGIATLVTLNFLVLWNELLFSLILLQQDSRRTVMVGISVLQGQYLTSVPLISAGLLFSVIPPLIIFLCFQRGLVRGLTAGAVK